MEFPHLVYQILAISSISRLKNDENSPKESRMTRFCRLCGPLLQVYMHSKLTLVVFFVIGGFDSCWRSFADFNPFFVFS